MSVNSSGIPLFDGIASTDDMFMATMEEMAKDPVNIININDPVWEYLKRNNMIEYREDIGTHVPVHLIDKENSTVKDFSHYDDADNTPQDALEEAKFAYGNVSGVQMYSRQELVQNSGKTQLIDLVKTKQDQLVTSMTNHVATRIKGTQDSDGRMTMGMGRIMTLNATCGGIDPTDGKHAYWNPQVGLKTGGGSYALATEQRAGIRRLGRLCTYLGERPDFMRAGEDLYDTMQAWAEDKLRMTLDDIKHSSGWGDHEMFTVNGQTVVYDPDLDPKRGELYNMKRVKVRIHKGTNFIFTPWQMMEGKVAAKKRNCLLTVSVYCERRNTNGYIQFT